MGTVDEPGTCLPCQHCHRGAEGFLPLLRPSVTSVATTATFGIWLLRLPQSLPPPTLSQPHPCPQSARQLSVCSKCWPRFEVSCPVSGVPTTPNTSAHSSEIEVGREGKALPSFTRKFHCILILSPIKIPVI